MVIALAVCHDRLATVFEVADALVVVKDGSESNPCRRRIEIGRRHPMARVSMMRELEVSILLCGAIAMPLQGMLESAGIEVIPFLRGSVDDVLDAYRRGRLGNPDFWLPGCRFSNFAGGHRRGRGRCRGARGPKHRQWRGGMNV
ncbi:MAG: NifB/NifX family molybdenum-iron cluster-binding protein [Deltaproteobacteria bacterium]|nr:NifB/NifX family molybdenum-iron cluster-binding protein [Deltaproteobacteria bacterium]